MKKRLLCFALTLALLVGLFPAVSWRAAAAQAPTALWIEPSETNGLPARIDVFEHKIQTGGSTWNPTYTTYYEIYLPGNAVVENCLLSWDGDTQVTVGGTAYSSGACPIPSPTTTCPFSWASV